MIVSRAALVNGVDLRAVQSRRHRFDHTGRGIKQVASSISKITVNVRLHAAAFGHGDGSLTFFAAAEDIVLNRGQETARADRTAKAGTTAGRTAAGRYFRVAALGFVIDKSQETQRGCRFRIHAQSTAVGVSSCTGGDLGIFADTVAALGQVAAEGTVQYVAAPLNVNSTARRNGRSQVTLRRHTAGCALRYVVEK